MGIKEKAEGKCGVMEFLFVFEIHAMRACLLMGIIQWRAKISNAERERIAE